MWILNWLPNMVFHLMLLLGILMILSSWVLKFFPGQQQYTLPLQILGIVITIVGVWYEGGIAKDAEYNAKIAAYNNAIKIYQSHIVDNNKTVQVHVITKYKIIKEKSNAVGQYITDNKDKINSTCGNLSKEAIAAHNAAALNKSVDEYLTPNSVIKTDEFNKAAKKK